MMNFKIFFETKHSIYSDWNNFKIEKLYDEGFIQRYIFSQHHDFQDDFRINGNYKLISINPNNIEKSEWEIDNEQVLALSKSPNQYPPVVMNKDNDVVDGGHRLEAAKIRGDKEILVFLQQ